MTFTDPDEDHRMSHRTLLVAAMLTVGLAFAGCASTAPAQPTLYERLGGRDSIAAVVDDGIVNISNDPRINGRFAGVDVVVLKRNLVDLVCVNTGGPCKYTGRSMADSHDGMNIRDDEFDALAEDLVKSLDKYKVPPHEKAELVAILLKMRNAIVGH